MGRVRAWIKSCWVGSRREHVRDVTIATMGIPKIQDSSNSGIRFIAHSILMMTMIKP